MLKTQLADHWTAGRLPLAVQPSAEGENFHVEIEFAQSAQKAVGHCVVVPCSPPVSRRWRGPSSRNGCRRPRRTTAISRPNCASRSTATISTAGRSMATDTSVACTALVARRSVQFRVPAGKPFKFTLRKGSESWQIAATPEREADGKLRLVRRYCPTTVPLSPIRCSWRKTSEAAAIKIGEQERRRRIHRVRGADHDDASAVTHAGQWLGRRQACDVSFHLAYSAILPRRPRPASAARCSSWRTSASTDTWCRRAQIRSGQ